MVSQVRGPDSNIQNVSAFFSIFEKCIDGEFSLAPLFY